MVARLFAAGLIAASLLARVPAPSQFYVVSVIFSDAAPFYYFRVLEVKPEGGGSLVRYSRIAQTGVWCPRTIVQTVEAHAAKLPGDLTGRSNLCAVRPDALKTTLKSYEQRASVFETISFGVVAQCGASSVSLSLPDIQGLKIERLKRDHPEMEQLWHLSSFIKDSVFGDGDLFHDRTEADQLALQKAGEKIVPELISGKYDAGFAAASGWKSPSFRSELARYKGPVVAPEGKPIPRLRNPERYQFSRYTAPGYPHMAVEARIQGQVELQLTVNNSSGEVTDVAVLFGHPLLKDPAVDAAKQWRFIPGSVGAQPVKVALDFDLTCPSQ